MTHHYRGFKIFQVEGRWFLASRGQLVWVSADGFASVAAAKRWVRSH